MWLRIIGITLILVCTTLMGAYFALRERYRLQDLQELERAVLLLENHILYLGEPLPEVLESISYKTFGNVGMILQEIAQEMGRRQEETADMIWERVWKRFLPKTYFSGEDYTMILSFGRTLGFLGKSQQKGSTELFLHEIRDAEQKLNKKLEKNGKLYYGMGMLGGILLAVVLL